MIDLHCHILPDFAVDLSHGPGGETDAETSAASAIEACQLAWREGISHIIATPHIYPGVNLEAAAGIEESVARMRRRLCEEGIKVQLLAGAEVGFSEDLADGLGRTPGLALAGKNYLLVEPPLLCMPLAAAQTFRLLVEQGIRPILGHPERVLEFQENPRRLEEMVEAGALLQITAAHLIGWGGGRLRRYCERLVKSGLVHFVGSDAHLGDRRVLAMRPAWKRLVRLAGEEAASRLMRENPLAVLEGRPLQRLAGL